MAEGKNRNGRNNGSTKARQNRKGEAGEKISTLVMAWAVEKRDELVKEAIEDPASDAGQMIHVLLLNAIIDQRANISELTLGKLLEEQRRYRELMARTSQWKREHEHDKQRLKLVKLKIQEATLKLEGLRKNHRPARLVDFKSILSTISAAIGLGEPLAPRVEEAPAG